jgi:uncharacterized protein (TIGR03792 family)
MLEAVQGHQGRVIEWLRFSVPVDWQERFIASDAAIWTAYLAQQPGFLGKKVIRNSKDQTCLALAIHWQSRAHWHAVPRLELEAVDRAFSATLGQQFPVLDCIDYEVLAD